MIAFEKTVLVIADFLEDTAERLRRRDDTRAGRPSQMRLEAAESPKLLLEFVYDEEEVTEEYVIDPWDAEHLALYRR